MFELTTRPAAPTTATPTAPTPTARELDVARRTSVLYWLATLTAGYAAGLAPAAGRGNLRTVPPAALRALAYFADQMADQLAECGYWPHDLTEELVNDPMADPAAVLRWLAAEAA